MILSSNSCCHEFCSAALTPSPRLATSLLQELDSFGAFDDLFGRRRLLQADPFAGDPFGGSSSGGGGSGGDPFASGGSGGGGDPFASSGGDPFDPFGSSSASDPLAAAGAGASDVPWDLGGGWMSGMGGGELGRAVQVAAQPAGANALAALLRPLKHPSSQLLPT